MRYLLLALLLMPFAAADQFNVGLTVYGCTVDFNGYEQLSTAQLNGSPVPLRAPLNVTSNGTCALSVPVQFRNATNFTADENGTLKATTRTSNTISWNATITQPYFLLYSAAPPAANTTTTQTDTSYRLAITLNASTALRNSSYSFTVPAGYSDYRLTETLSGTIDRTLTYNLIVNGTTASFTNVFFTANVMKRSLVLTASKASTPATGGAGGGGGGAVPVTNDTAEKGLEYSFPERIEAVRDTTATTTATIFNSDAKEQTVTIGLTPVDSLRVYPLTLSIAAGASKEITFIYTPDAFSEEQEVKLTLKSSDGKQKLVKVLLVPLEEPPELTIDIKPTAATVAITGMAPEGELRVIVRTDTGEVVREVTVEVVEGRYSSQLDISEFGSGTYEVCAVSVLAGEARENCDTLELRRPAQEEPSAAGSLGLPTYVWIFIYVTGLGLVAWLFWRLFWAE